MRDLTDTTSAEVGQALDELRRRSGNASRGRVLTLVVATDERSAYDAMRAAVEASRAHPSRIVAVVKRAAKAAGRLDAEVRIGGDAGLGESVVLRLYGQLADHADSVVLPLLLPDAPMVVWWPGAAPPVPARTPLGQLAQRRITDAAAAPGRVGGSVAALAERAAGHRPCDTDLAWTRLTPWRALLAAALDQPHDPIRSASVAAARGNPSAVLLAAWLHARLGVPAELRASRGPGITAVRMATDGGDIAVTRPDGQRATLSRPGDPDRTVALPRRRTAELLAEELRRLDDDEVYGETLRAAATLGLLAPGPPAVRPAGRAKTHPRGRSR